MQLALSQIRTDGGTQPRQQISFLVVDEYAEAMGQGVTLPPVDVYYDGNDYWLVDGFHRIAAARNIGRANISANVTQGTLQDAQWASYGVNATHGLRRTNEDKRRAVEAALRHPNAASKSTRDIAAHCGVSKSFVHNLKPSVHDGQIEVTRNGTTYQMQTANIGQRSEPAARPAYQVNIVGNLADEVAPKQATITRLEDPPPAPWEDDDLPEWLHDDDKPQYRRDQSQPAAEPVATCACGAKLSPNDTRLGFTECKACERARIDAEDAAGLDVPPEASEEPAYNYKRDAKTNRPGDLYEPKGYDACQTPPHAVDPLLPYLPTDLVIWEPAQGEGFLVEAFYDSSRRVIGSDILDGQNFFEYEPDEDWDVIVTNPPYSLKFKWLERCYQLGKPFALLLPVETLGAATSQAMFEQYGMELLLLNKRVNFKMPNKGWDGAGAQFPVAWFTWGLNLESSIVYGKL